MEAVAAVMGLMVAAMRSMVASMEHVVAGDWVVTSVDWAMAAGYGLVAEDDWRIATCAASSLRRRIAGEWSHDPIRIGCVDRARRGCPLLRGPQTLIDPRNHLPMPWPMGWHGPYALEARDTYRIDTPDCAVVARIESEAWDFKDIDVEGNPRHMWLLEIAVERALDPTPASDEQVAEITARFRHCGQWFDRTSYYERRHPSRRFFAAEIRGHREGTTPWPEIRPFPGVMLGPPPGWEPVGPCRDPPLVFRIEGTKLRVEWTPPPGADGFEAATGRTREPSRFILSAEGRTPTDEEASTVFAMLGGAAFTEEKRPRSGAKGKARARAFRATAGWLRKASGRA